MLLKVEGKTVWALQRVQRTCEVGDVRMNNVERKQAGGLTLTDLTSPPSRKAPKLLGPNGSSSNNTVVRSVAVCRLRVPLIINFKYAYL